MNQILDDDFKTNKNSDGRRAQSSFLYAIIMLIGGALFLKYATFSGSRASLIQLLVTSFLIQVMLILMSVLFNLMLRILRRGIRKKSKILNKAFFLNSIQSGFVLWVILLGIILLDKVLL